MNFFEHLSNIFRPAESDTDNRKSNSREAYESVKPKLYAMHHQILYALKKGPGNVWEIADRAGLHYTQVGKRMKELKEAGHVRPFCDGKSPSGVKCTVWRRVDL